MVVSAGARSPRRGNAAPRVSAKRVAGARLVVAANNRLKQPTPGWVVKLAETPPERIKR